MTTIKTNTGRELKVTSNQQKRHFTIYSNGVKFRTLPMSREEFENAEFWTANDWQDFLNRNSGAYYEVKK